MNQPKPLQKGDTVAILSTARKISIPEIEPAISLLHSWDLKVILGSTIDLEAHQFAGNDAARAGNLQQFLNEEDIAAIWCARGGYGTIRIIDRLDFSYFSKRPKWIIGYSDVTVLHSLLHNLDVPTIHATMPINVAKNTPETLQSLHDTLFGKSIEYTIPASKYNKKGSARGQLVGGNLSMLYSMTGTEAGLNTKGKILFLEDLDEYLYHIDRMLMNLKYNGCFDGLAGLIVGGMTNMHDNTIPFGKNAQEIILDITSLYNFPVCFDFPAGHLDDNRAMIFGKEASLTVDDEVILTI